VTQEYPPEWRAGAAIRDLLEPGERLLWQGRPEPGRGPVDPEFLPALWVCWALALALLAWWAIDEDAWSALGVGALVIALLLSLAAWASTRRVPRHHAYAVTDRRVLMVAGRRRGIRVAAYAPPMIATIQRHDHEDGTADIVFRQGPHLAHTAGIAGLLTLSGAVPFAIAGRTGGNPVGFQYLRDAQAAIDALSALRDRHPVAAAPPPWDGSAPDREATP
jgi:hypothetical protein